MMKIKNSKVFLLILSVIVLISADLYTGELQKNIYFLKFPRKKYIRSKRLLNFINEMPLDISRLISEDHKVLFTEKRVSNKILKRNDYDFAVTGRFIIGFKTFLIKYSLINVRTGLVILSRKMPVDSLSNKSRESIINKIASNILNAINDFSKGKPYFISLKPESGKYNEKIKIAAKLSPKNAVVRYEISKRKEPAKPGINSSVLPESGLIINENTSIKLRVFSKYGVPGQTLSRKYTFKPAKIVLSKNQGNYKKKITVKIKSNTSNAVVYYTFGEEVPKNPGLNSKKFPENGITIDKSSFLKVLPIKKGWEKGVVQTFRYTIVKPKPKKPKKKAVKKEKKKEKTGLKDSFNINLKGSIPIYGSLGFQFKLYQNFYMNLKSGYWIGKNTDKTSFEAIPIILNLDFYILSKGAFRPYLTLGFGYLLEMDGKLNAPYSFFILAGFETYLSEGFSFFGEAGVIVFDENLTFSAGGGFKFYLF